MKRIALALLMAIALSVYISGCLQPAIMKPTVQAFSALDQADAIKRLIVLPYDEQQASSLEWKTYAAKIEARFVKAGYSITKDAAQAQLVAYFGYGIDAGQEVLTNYAIPQYGVTGYNSATTTGTVTSLGNFSTINATTTYQPSYGVTGYVSGTRRDIVYTRSLSIDMLDVATNQKKWEMRLNSSGSCGAIAPVMDPFLDAAFRNFPQSSSGKVLVPTIVDC